MNANALRYMDSSPEKNEMCAVRYSMIARCIEMSPVSRVELYVQETRVE